MAVYHKLCGKRSYLYTIESNRSLIQQKETSDKEGNAGDSQEEKKRESCEDTLCCQLSSNSNKGQKGQAHHDRKGSNKVEGKSKCLDHTAISDESRLMPGKKKKRQNELE